MEKFDDWIDSIQIGRLDRQHLSGFTGQRIFSRAYLLKYRLESRSTKDPEDHFDAEVGLEGLDLVTAKKPCEISGRWVGSIQLRERRDEQ